MNKGIDMKRYFLFLFALLLLSGCAISGGSGVALLDLSEKDGGYQVPPISPELQKKLEKGFDLTLALKLAWQRNPLVQAARFRWRAAIEKIPQATSYADPMISYLYQLESVETRVGPQKGSLGIQQKIPFPGKLSLKGDMAAYDADIMRIKAEKILRNILVDVKIAYQELFYIHRAKELYSKQKALLQRYVAFAAGEHGKNRIKFTETFKAQSFLAQMGYEEILLKEMEASQVQMLKSLLNLSSAVSLGKPENIGYIPLKGSLQNFIRRGEKHSEEIQIALKKVGKASSALTLAKMGWLPDFTVMFQWVQVDKAAANVTDSGKDPFVVGGGINLPIWWHKNNARIDEKYYALEGLKKEIQGVRQNLRSQIAKEYFKLTNAERLTRIYREQLIPQARQALVTAEQRYREKVSNFAAVLETTSVWFNFQLAYWRALVDYNQARARMERLVGRGMKL